MAKKIDCHSLKQHIVEHEILGVGQSSGGGGNPDQSVIDGYLTYTDPLRGKRLSVSRLSFTGAKKDKAENIGITNV